MVNSPVVSTADSASDWSSPGVAQPPRIPSRSLFTIPPGVVEHPHTELGRPFRSSEAVHRAPDPPVRRGGPVPGFCCRAHPSLITTTTPTAGPSTPPVPATASHLAQK